MNTARNACTWIANAMLFSAWFIRLVFINSGLKTVRKEIAYLERLERNLPAAFIAELNRQSQGIDQQREAEHALNALRGRLNTWSNAQ